MSASSALLSPRYPARPRRPASVRGHKEPFAGASPLPQRSSGYGTEVREISTRRLLHGGRESALSTRHGEEVTAHVWSLQCHRHHDREPTHVARHSGPLCPARAGDSHWLRDALMTAIQRDSAAEIEALVLKGAPLYNIYSHQFGPSGRARFVNAVDWAALEERFRPALQLLELGQRLGGKGLTPGLPELAGRTVRAVYMAAKAGEMELLHRLLESSAVPGQRGVQGESALHAAVQSGHPHAAALLLQYGAWAVEEQEQRREVLKDALARGVACVAEGAGVPLAQAQVLAEDLAFARREDVDPEEQQRQLEKVDRALEPYAATYHRQPLDTARHRVRA